MIRYERVNGQRVRCYDNGGKTADRYTVVYLDAPEGLKLRGTQHFECVGMSADPFHPQGVGMHSIAACGAHLGKRVSFDSLPADCQRLVKRDLAFIEVSCHERTHETRRAAPVQRNHSRMLSRHARRHGIRH